MPSSTVVKRPKSKPFARLFVADEVRIENNGKLIAIGLYTDGIVLFRVPRNAPPPTPEMPYAIDSLALVAVVGGFEGEATIRVSLGKSNPVEQILTLKAGRSANLHLPMKPFRFGSFGVKELTVEFAETKFKLPFEIRAEYVDAVENLDAYMEVVTRNPTRRSVKADIEDAKIVARKPSKPQARPKAKRT